MEKLRSAFFAVKRFIAHRPLIAAVTVSFVPAFIFCAVSGLIFYLSPSSSYESFGESVYETLFLSGVFGALILPGVLTLLNILFLVRDSSYREIIKAGKGVEIATIIYGALCVFAYSSVIDMFSDIVFADWNEQLYNTQSHFPVATWTLPTLITIAAVGFAGYLVLRFVPLKKLPPIPAALSIAAMYLGGALCVTLIIQLAKNDLILCVLPFNLLLIELKTLREVTVQWTVQWDELQQESELTGLRGVVCRSANWPWLALIAALPLLGIIIALLMLFGQQPDSIIQAWTQTADWTFSQKAAPQNIFYDEHYLCTVAAGGHRKVVKPLRYGKRHGHRVIVNRQLCVANAFEQLLEERTPRFHRAVRDFYDKYGYPVARLIRSPYAADAVWFIMKPLEWLFVAVLYTFDAKPENRIAVQYPHAPLPKEYSCQN